MKLAEHIVTYLKDNSDRDIPEEYFIVNGRNAGYEVVEIQSELKALEAIANIGGWRNDSGTWYRWYQPNKLTKKVQECIDRGDDW